MATRPPWNTKECPWQHKANDKTSADQIFHVSFITKAINIFVRFLCEIRRVWSPAKCYICGQRVKMVQPQLKQKILFQGNTEDGIQFHRQRTWSQHTQRAHHHAHEHCCQPVTHCSYLRTTLCVQWPSERHCSSPAHSTAVSTALFSIWQLLQFVFQSQEALLWHTGKTHGKDSCHFLGMFQHLSASAVPLGYLFIDMDPQLKCLYSSDKKIITQVTFSAILFLNTLYKAEFRDNFQIFCTYHPRSNTFSGILSATSIPTKEKRHHGKAVLRVPGVAWDVVNPIKRQENPWSQRTSQGTQVPGIPTCISSRVTEGSCLKAFPYIFVLITSGSLHEPLLSIINSDTTCKIYFLLSLNSHARASKILSVTRIH